MNTYTQIEPINRRAALSLGATAVLGALSFPKGVVAQDVSSQLKKTKEGSKKLNKGIRILSGAAYKRAIQEPSKLFAKVGSRLNHIAGRFSRATQAVDRLIEIDDEQEALREAPRVSREFSKLTETKKGFLGELAAAEKAIDKIEVGHISEKSHPGLEVTLDMVLDDRPEAVKRFVKLGKAMELNIENLEEIESDLDDLSNYGNRAKKALRILSDTLYEAYRVGGGLFRDFFALEGLEVERFGKATASVANAAERKRDKVSAVLSKEQKRYKNFKTNLKTFWGIKI